MAVYGIITFHTTHFSLKAKKILEKNGKNPELIPVPREFSSDCGFCCKIPWEEKDETKKLLKENNVEIDCIYRWVREDNKERKKRFRFV